MATPLHQIIFPFTRTTRNGQLITFVRYVADDPQPWHTDKGRRYSQNGSFLGGLSAGDCDVDPFPDVEVPEGFEALAPPLPTTLLPFMATTRGGELVKIVSRLTGASRDSGSYCWQGGGKGFSYLADGRVYPGQESLNDIVSPLPDPMAPIGAAPSGDPHLDALAANRPGPPSPLAETPSTPGPARFPFEIRNRAGGYTTITHYIHGYAYPWQSQEHDSFTQEGRYMAGGESQKDLVGPLPEPPEEVESHPRRSSPQPIDPPAPKEPPKMPTIRQFIPNYLLILTFIHLTLFGLATVAWHTMVSWRVLYGLHDSLWPSTDAWVIHPPVPVEKR